MLIVATTPPAPADRPEEEFVHLSDARLQEHAEALIEAIGLLQGDLNRVQAEVQRRAAAQRNQLQHQYLTKEPYRVFDFMAISIPYNIPLRRVFDLIVNAYDSGAFSYWIDRHSCSAELPEGFNLDTIEWLSSDERRSWKSENTDYFAPLVGGELMFVDKDGHLRTLDGEAISRGLVIMAEKYPNHFGDFMIEEDDAITADVFIQCCVLGEVVYG